MNMKWIYFCSMFCQLGLLSAATPPAGRLAFINDASASRDADDVCAIPFQVGVLAAFGATDKLVHWSYACDYEGEVIREDRMAALEECLFGAIKVWSDPKHGTIRPEIIFNLRDKKQRSSGVDHLKECINKSTEDDLLWIIEAGEPDVIGYALEAAEVDKRKFVRVVTHHPHNDGGADWKLTGNIAALPGMAKEFIVRIPDQNVELKKPEKDYAWMKGSKDPRIEFLWKQTKASTSLGWAPKSGIVDPSDAGMVWFVLDSEKDETPSPEKIGEKIATWCASHPPTHSTLQIPPQD